MSVIFERSFFCTTVIFYCAPRETLLLECRCHPFSAALKNDNCCKSVPRVLSGCSNGASGGVCGRAVES